MDLKILFLGKNDTNRIHHSWHAVRQELKKYVDVIEYGRGWNPEGKGWIMDGPTLVEKFKPDLIYILRYWNWENFDKIDVPKIMFVGDPHAHVQEHIDFINRAKIDMTIHDTRNPNDHFGMHTMKDSLPAEHKYRFLPYSINPDVFYDRKLEREYDLAFLGRSARSRYPLRSCVKNKFVDGNGLPLPSEYKIFTRIRPKRSWNYGRKPYLDGTIVARKEYAEAMNRCKVMPFGSSLYNYAVLKYVEVMGCNTLAMADMPGDGEELGFIPDKNFVEIGLDPKTGVCDNALEKIKYYVENDKERMKIAQRGYDLVHKYHTAEIRAKQLLNYFEELF